MKILSAIKSTVLFLLLTLVTQVGGVVYLCYKFIAALTLKKGSASTLFLKKLALFLLLYVIVSFVVVPPIAKHFGRVPLQIIANNKFPLQPRNLFYFVCNRHYVTPELRSAAMQIALDMRNNKPKVMLQYLDACFPFKNGFPLFPHKSHDDGEKLDLCFLYKDGNGNRANSPNFVGYGACELPRSGEKDQAAICEKQGYWQYSLLQKIISPLNATDHVFDEVANAKLLHRIAKHKSIRKIFIEPHLKTRLGLDDIDKIRFHGCGAVRHDDHIHIQL